VFGVLEWIELVAAFEDDRANPVSFAQWCDWKAQRPTWKLTRRDAIGCVIGSMLPNERRGFATLGAVLDGWGIHLVRVTYGPESPA
jgi:hypothetical protein